MAQRLYDGALTITALLLADIVFGGGLLAASKEHTATFQEIATYDADQEVIYKNGSVQRFPVKHTTHSKVWIRGNRLRAERVQRSQNAKKENEWIDILTPDGTYRLRPETRTGTKTPGVSKQKTFAMTDPTQMLSAFKEKGNVTKVGEAKVDGQPCDIYQTSADQSRVKLVIKLWVRRSDSIVIRLESKSESPRSLSVREYKKVQVDTAISDSLFEVPRGYKISVKVP